MSGFRVVGLDVSLTSTGMSDGQSVHAVQTAPDSGSLEARMDRIVRTCLDFVHSPTLWTDRQPGKAADLVVIEGPAFRAHGTAVDQLAGLRMLVRVELYRRGIPFAIVSPTALKAYTTNYGKATKAQMVAALAERHGLDLTVHKVSKGKYDMADAYALAAMGYVWIGQPIAPTRGAPAPMKSLLAAQWPETVPTEPSAPVDF